MESFPQAGARVSDDWGPLQYDTELAFEHPLLREAHSLWQELRGARELPRRNDLDPLRVPTAMLPHMQLLDIEAGPPQRYRWRLIGTHITTALGRDSTGKYWDELYVDSTLRSFMRGIELIQDHRRPIRCFGRSDFAQKHFQSFEAIEMPLSENQQDIGTVWIVAVYS